MKYDMRFSEDQNTERWRGEAEDRDPEAPIERQSPAVQAVAQQLNQVLTQLEAAVCADIAATRAALYARKADPADRLEDFEILLTLNYGLRQDDPEWEAFDENWLCVESQSLYEVGDPSNTEGFGLPVPAVPWPGWQGAPPCWTFVLLMEASGIAWADLPRIASVQRVLIVKTDDAPIPLD